MGGCTISKVAPKYTACECSYKGAWTAMAKSCNARTTGIRCASIQIFLRRRANWGVVTATATDDTNGTQAGSPERYRHSALKLGLRMRLHASMCAHKCRGVSRSLKVRDA